MPAAAAMQRAPLEASHRSNLVCQLAPVASRAMIGFPEADPT